MNKARIQGVSATAFAFYYGSAIGIIGSGHAVTRIEIRYDGKVYVFYYEPQSSGLDYAGIVLAGSNIETPEQMADVGRQFYGKYYPMIAKDVDYLAKNSPACNATNQSGGLRFNFLRNYYPDTWREQVAAGQQCPSKIPVKSVSTNEEVKTGIMLSCAATPPPNKDPNPPTPPSLDPIPAEVAVTNAINVPCSAADAPHIQCSLSPSVPLVHRDAGELGTDQIRRDLYPNAVIECSVDGFDPAKHRVSYDMAGVQLSEYPAIGRYSFRVDGSAKPVKAKITVTTSCKVPAPSQGSLNVEIKVSKNYGPVYTDRSGGYVSSTPAGISCGNGQTQCKMSCDSGVTAITLKASEVIGRGKFMGFIDQATGASLCMSSAVCTIQCLGQNHAVDAVFIEDLIMPGPNPGTP